MGERVYFLAEEAYNSQKPWRHFLNREYPCVGPYGVLTGVWADAMITALTMERRRNNWAGRPIEQVGMLMMKKGFGHLEPAFMQTIQAAQQGMIQCAQVAPPKPIRVACYNCGFVSVANVPDQMPSGSPVHVSCANCGAVNEGQLLPEGGLQQNHFAAAGPGSVVQPSGRHKALLIGINYFGTKAELRGCINDVHNLHGLLTQNAGWNPQNIRTLTDDGKGGGQPTRKNMEENMRWLVADAQPGDVLFFSFSGHGAQQEDPEGAERDGMNETLLPSDFEKKGMITDDQVSNMLVRPLPSGVRLTAVLDCCHSGTGMDLPFSWSMRSKSWEEETNPFHSQGDVIMFSGCEDDQTSSDVKTKYGQAGGAMTMAFTDVLRKNPSCNYAQLLDMLHRDLQKNGFKQRPLLSASQQFDTHQRVFGLSDIISNSNPTTGRIMRQRFKPNPRPMGKDDPLAGMLSTLGLIAAAGGATMAVLNVANAVGGGGDVLGGLQKIGGGLHGWGIMDMMK